MEFTNREIAEDLEACLRISVTSIFWRFHLTFRVTFSGLISLPRNRIGSFISQINYDYLVFSKEIRSSLIINYVLK